MKRYKIYENQAGLKEAVKQGWSWPAAFFNWIWAFVKKINLIGGVTLGVFFFLGAVVGASGNEDVFDGLFFLLTIAAFVVFGVNGNAWREKNLVTRGYMLRGETSAESDEAALAASDLQQSKLPPPPPPRSMKPDPVYRVASNGVDLGEMKVSAIRTAISEGRISYEDHYFDVTANAWRVLQGLAHLET